MELDFSPKLCEITPPTPLSEVSTSTMKVFEGLECLRMGAVLKASLSCLKAWFVEGFHWSFLGPFFNSKVRSEFSLPKPLINLLQKLKNTVLDCHDFVLVHKNSTNADIS